ncbi:hypothetical protein OBBRIDRAFT_691196, partial [Obba rivulosa]
VLDKTSAQGAWDRLCEHYEGKGKQTIVYLIGELFRSTLSNEAPLELQLNAMRQKACILTSLGTTLSNNLVAVAIVILLPSSYDTLR